MNKIVTKTTSAIFLAFVLVTGTIAAISPSFIIKGVNAQGDPYYDGMDSRYDDRKSYGMDDNYGSSDYGMDKKPPVYGMDKKPPVYGMDSRYDDRKLHDKRSYGNDDGYKPQYTSYDGKDDDRDKSKKDSSKSVSLNKLKCVNTNININGNNTGDINVGNKGTAGGYLGASSYGSSGYDGDRGYDGYNKQQDKGFDCIINNNNTNINTVVSNGTDDDDDDDKKPTCDECFARLSPVLQTAINTFLFNTGAIQVSPTVQIPADVNDIKGLCLFLDRLSPTLTLTTTQINQLISAFLAAIPTPPGPPIGAQAELQRLIECLIDADVLIRVG